MDKQTATTAFINSCLDVNASWRETFNEIGLLWTLEIDIDQGWTIIGDCIRENLAEQDLVTEDEEVTDQEVDELIYGYLQNECKPYTKELILAMHDWAAEAVENIGCEEELTQWLEAN